MTDLRKKVLIAVPLIAIVIIIVLFSKNTETEQDAEFSQVEADDPSDENGEASEKTDSEMAIVDIKGEVEQPGVYEIGLDKRIDDVLELAGGLTGDADEIAINRAEKVHDEMVIIVPEEGGESIDNEDGNSTSDKIRINQATQEEIETLNGIGPSKAEAIIEYREENGPFEKAEDLLDISGLGEKTLENLMDDILVP